MATLPTLPLLLLLVFVLVSSLFTFTQAKTIIAKVSDRHSFDFHSLAAKWNSKYLGPLRGIPSIHLFETSDEKRDEVQLDLLERSFPEGEVMWVEFDEPLKYRPIPTRQPPPQEWEPSDPKAWDQWHLFHTRADEGWKMGYSGNGVIVSVIDSGTNKHSTDLGNLDISNSWNYVTETSDPTPPSSKCIKAGDDCSHGTTCANLAVGQTNNFCGLGIAPNSTLQGFLVLAPRGYGSTVTTSDWADAQSYPTDVSSNSYGGVACSKKAGTTNCGLISNSNLDQSVVESLANTGRSGKGTIILYASGNDGDIFEDTNIQGILTFRQIMAIGASTVDYVRSSWSCPGAGLMCLAPGESLFGSTVQIRKSGNQEICANIGSGTSWSTPITAGAASLLLEANRNLTWRDVQHIIVRSSYRQPSSDWILNSGRRQFSYNSGFGNLDVSSALKLATNWVSFPKELSVVVQKQEKVTVDSSVNYNFVVNQDLMVESVNLVLDISVPARGSLDIEIISPSGTKHPVLKARPDKGANYKSWQTLARGFWDERSSGQWTVRVTKNAAYAPVGTTVINWMKLTVYGTSPSEYPRAPELSTLQTPFLKLQSVTSTQATIMFTRSDQATPSQNELQMRANLQSDWKTVTTTSQSTYTVSGLTTRSSYLFRGRSLVSTWSEWGQVLSVNTR